MIYRDGGDAGETRGEARGIEKAFYFSCIGMSFVNGKIHVNPGLLLGEGSEQLCHLFEY